MHFLLCQEGALYHQSWATLHRYSDFSPERSDTSPLLMVQTTDLVSCFHFCKSCMDIRIGTQADQADQGSLGPDPNVHVTLKNIIMFPI